MTEDETSTSKGERKKCYLVHRQAREMALRVLEKCALERKNKKLTIDIKKSIERAANYTGLSMRMLSRVQSEAKSSEDGTLRTPKRKGKKINKKNNISIDDFDYGVIRRCIADYYIKECKAPTTPKLLAVVKKKMDFPWESTSFRNMLKKMGYIRHAGTKKRIIMEKPSITFSRACYLRKIRQYRRDDRCIYFVGEAWIDEKYIKEKHPRSDVIKAVQLEKNSSANGVILVHAGSRKGFLDGAKLVLKASITNDDYYGQMNASNFEKWVVQKLIPSLPSNSVVVMDNASYHTVQINKVPSKTCSKQTMINWLMERNISVTPESRKDEVYSLILRCREHPEKLYKIDQIFKNYGHEVVRLPKYMNDLNPIELVFKKIRRIVKQHNVNDEFLKEFTEMAVNHVSEQDWRGFDDHVVALEEYYWHKDGEMEVAVDRLIADAQSGDDDSESSDDDDSICMFSDSDSD